MIKSPPYPGWVLVNGDSSPQHISGIYRWVPPGDPAIDGRYERGHEGISVREAEEMSRDLHGMHKLVDTGAVPGVWYTKPYTPPPPSIQPISFLKPESHPKAWGEETWWVNNDKYCAKSLKFLAGKEFSDHFHWLKEETWICVSGELVLEYYDLSNADRLTKTIKPGDVIHVPPGNPHKLRAVTDALIWEVSSKHYESDSYRIGKGSSQSKDPQANTISFPGSSGKPFDYGRWGLGASSPTQDYGKRVRLDKDSFDPRGGRNVGEIEGVVEEVRPVSCAWAVYIRTDDGRLVCANPYQCHLVTDAKESGWKS